MISSPFNKISRYSFGVGVEETPSFHRNYKFEEIPRIDQTKCCGNKKNEVYSQSNSNRCKYLLLLYFLKPIKI